jgi:hypothetical protein
LLTTGAQGRFSDNAFTLLPGNATQVQFLPWGGADQYDALSSTLRVEHLARYGGNLAEAPVT